MRTNNPLLVLVALAGCACGPEKGREPTEEGRRYAAGVCSAFAECGCVARYSSDETCEADLAARFDDVLEDGDLRILPGCLDELLDGEALNDCLPPEQWPSVGSCAVLQGEQDVGQSCSDRQALPGLAIAECKQGLLCVDGRCWSEDPHAPAKDLGDSCDTSCHSQFLYCGLEDGKCHTEVEPGGACDSTRACTFVPEKGAYCQGLGSAGEIGTCAPKIALGGNCDPLDSWPCASETESTWCDPATQTCVNGGPGICSFVDDNPVTWPAPA